MFFCIIVQWLKVFLFSKADAAAEKSDAGAEKADAASDKADAAVERADAAAEKPDATAEKTDAEGSKNDELTNENTDPLEANTEAKDAQDEEVDTTKAGNESNDTTLPVEGVENNPEWYKHKFYSRIFESLCRRRLPALLPKYKEVSVFMTNYLFSSFNFFYRFQIYEILEWAFFFVLLCSSTRHTIWFRE